MCRVASASAAQTHVLPIPCRSRQHVKPARGGVRRRCRFDRQRANHLVDEEAAADSVPFAQPLALVGGGLPAPRDLGVGGGLEVHHEGERLALVGAQRDARREASGLRLLLGVHLPVAVGAGVTCS